jgi:hypothetical protein
MADLTFTPEELQSKIEELIAQTDRTIPLTGTAEAPIILNGLTAEGSYKIDGFVTVANEMFGEDSTESETFAIPSPIFLQVFGENTTEDGHYLVAQTLLYPPVEGECMLITRTGFRQSGDVELEWKSTVHGAGNGGEGVTYRLELGQMGNSKTIDLLGSDGSRSGFGFPLPDWSELQNVPQVVTVTNADTYQNATIVDIGPGTVLKDTIPPSTATQGDLENAEILYFYSSGGFPFGTQMNEEVHAEAVSNADGFVFGVTSGENYAAFSRIDRYVGIEDYGCNVRVQNEGVTATYYNNMGALATEALGVGWWSFNGDVWSKTFEYPWTNLEIYLHKTAGAFDAEIENMQLFQCVFASHPDAYLAPQTYFRSVNGELPLFPVGTTPDITALEARVAALESVIEAVNTAVEGA